MLVVRKTWQEYRESTEYRTYSGRLGGYTVTPDTAPKVKKYSAAGSSAGDIDDLLGGIDIDVLTDEDVEERRANYEEG